ncbi:RloB family protein [Maribacter chungangensis]|uniref:RloB family protein n=1 Tax=Maribacter chungangensis TaxID=1069117 RepID=A0ABW3B9Z1_9FLAO
MARNNRKTHKRKGKKTFSIIVDGETEVWYLQMLKKNEKLPRIDIKPELPKKKKLSEQFESVLENAKDYDKVIWIVDYDTIIKETNEARKGEKTAIQYLKDYIKTIQDSDNIEILINAPCLEFWLLLHFEKTGKFFSNCDDAGKILKRKYLKDYEKSEKYFKKRDNDIYQKLKENQITAKENAALLGEFDFNNHNKALSEIYKLFEFLEIK